MDKPNFGIAKSPKALDRFLRQMTEEINDLIDLTAPLRIEREKRLAELALQREADLAARSIIQTQAEKIAEARRIVAEAEGKAQARERAKAEAERLAKVEAEKLVAAKKLLSEAKPKVKPKITKGKNK